MTRLILAIALIAIVSSSGCVVVGPDADSPDPEGLVISGGSSFGECLGYCRNTLTIWEGDMTLVRQGWHDRQLPDLLYERGISDEEWSSLLRIMNESQFRSLDEIYGCPDCADGGAEWVQLSTDDWTHRVTFEFGEDVHSIEPLIEGLRSIREDWLASLQ